ncbi:MAG: hypothetical protein JST61_09850 [Acidobacteria bacterium]|nr:hypothetical protein [Acidobacteriota bacterium]
MKKACIVALICFPTLVFAKDHQWHSGILLSYDQQTFTTYSQSKGSGHETPHTTYRVQIDTGDKVYFAERTLNWAWQKFPKVTENGPIKWELKGNDEMVISDDKGKDFTLTITKTRIKPASPSN